MIRHAVPLLLLASLAIAAPRRDTVSVEIEKGPNPWNHLNVFNDPDRFQFAIVSDRTGGHREGVFETAIDKLNLLQPEFVMSVGDLIEGFTDNEAEIDRQWDEFTGFIAKLQMPFFYVPGNHDYSNATMAKVWKRRFGRDFFHFAYRDVLFLCLNSENPQSSRIGDEQVAYAKAVLARHPKVRWTLVFFHRPLWTYTKPKKDGSPADPTGFEKVEDLLRGRKYAVFVGHNHNYMKFDRYDRRYFILGATGGINEMRGVPFGEFDQVAWVTMTDEGPIVANLLLSGILDENVVTERSGPLVDKLVAGAPRQVTSLMTAKAPAREVPFTLKSTNDADLPMTVRFRFEPPGSYAVEPREVEETVPPNSVKTFGATLMAPAAIPAEALPTVGFDWTMSYPAAADAPPVVLTGRGAVHAEAAYPVTRLAKPVAVDGAAADWGTLPIRCDRMAQPESVIGMWRNPADLSFKMGVAQDGKELFVTVDVTDDERVVSTSYDPWDQDGLSISIDPRPEADRLDPKQATKEARDASKQAFAFFMSPGETAATQVLYGKEWYPAGARSGCRARRGGWTAEVAVPFAVLDAGHGGKPWESVRINVCVYDFDTSSIKAGLVGYGTYFYWKPDWDGALDYPGSGTFRRR